MLQPTSRECELGALGVFSASCRQLRRCTRCWTNSGCQRRAVHEEICFIWWWHISWHGSEAMLWVCKKSFIEGSLRNVDKIQTKMKTVEEEKEVVELVENNHALVAELPFWIQITQSSVWRRKWSQNVQKRHPRFFKILVGLFLSQEVSRASKSVSLYYLFNRRHWTDVLAL